VVFDAGYNVARLAYPPVELLGRLRSDRSAESAAETWSDHELGIC
jgi:hypothetical protein